MALPLIAAGIGAGAGLLSSLINSGSSRNLDKLRREAMQRALGTGGPSAAEAMLQRQGQLAQQRALGLAKASPGANPNLALRNAMRAGSQAQADLASRAATLRAQEQQQALGQAAALETQAQQNKQKILGGLLSGVASGLGMLTGGAGSGGVAQAAGGLVDGSLRESNGGRNNIAQSLLGQLRDIFPGGLPTPGEIGQSRDLVPAGPPPNVSPPGNRQESEDDQFNFLINLLRARGPFAR